MSEPYYMKQEREAAEKVRTALALPLPETADEVGCEGVFDPWEIFPTFYGSYSGEFDKMALIVLRNLRDRTVERQNLAHEMFREYLCRVGLCDYGTSPRVCFPTSAFTPLLPDLIAKWHAHSMMHWGEDVTA